MGSCWLWRRGLQWSADCARVIAICARDRVVYTTQNTIAAAVAAGVHVEVTTLVIPGRNDDPGEIAAAAQWLASLSSDIPLHLSRYFPRYHCDIDPTPVATLRQLQHIARLYLSHVYPGNV